MGSAASELGIRALAEAKKHIGTKESPPVSGCTMFGAWYGANGVPWCNIFVSYCFKTGAGYAIADGFPGGRGAGVFRDKGCAYVPTTEAWLRTTGMWLGRVAPEAGDIAIYNWNGGEPDHIGIVTRDLGNGTFEAIEGNTSLGNNSNGGGSCSACATSRRWMASAASRERRAAPAVRRSEDRQRAVRICLDLMIPATQHASSARAAARGAAARCAVKRCLGRMPSRRDPRTLPITRYLRAQLPGSPPARDWSGCEGCCFVSPTRSTAPYARSPR